MTDYPIVVSRLPDDEGGGYLGFAPDLPGCMSDGESPEEALRNASAAVVDWIEVARGLGREVPEPNSAAKRDKEREELLIEAVHVLAELHAAFGERIKSLVREAERAGHRRDGWAPWDGLEPVNQSQAGGRRAVA